MPKGPSKPVFKRIAPGVERLLGFARRKLAWMQAPENPAGDLLAQRRHWIVDGSKVEVFRSFLRDMIAIEGALLYIKSIAGETGNRVFRSIAAHGNFAGLANHTRGIFSVWYQPDQEQGNLHSISFGNVPAIPPSGSSPTATFRLLYSPTLASGVLPHILLDFYNGGQTDETRWTATVPDNEVPGGTGWIHVLFSYDIGINQYRFYVNETLTNLSLSEASGGPEAIRESGAGVLFTDWEIIVARGCAAEMYWAPGQYLDFEALDENGVPFNRRKFISGEGVAVSLGGDGSKPTGVVPVVYSRLAINNDRVGAGINLTGAGDFVDADGRVDPVSLFEKCEGGLKKPKVGV